MYEKDDLGYKRKLKRLPKRPALLTLICILVVLFGFWNIISMYMRVYPGISTLYPALNALMVVFSFIAISGIWSMEKWGPITFPVVVTMKLLIDLIFDQFNPWYLAGYLLAAFFFLYFKQMRKTE